MVWLCGRVRVMVWMMRMMRVMRMMMMSRCGEEEGGGSKCNGI